MTASPGPPEIFDPHRRRARLARSRRLIGGADFLHRRAADNAVDTLQATLRDFAVVVDLSAHPQVLLQSLAEAGIGDRMAAPRALGDAAAPGLAALDLPDSSADLVVSLMTLHWANDLPGALSQIRRALKPDGLFLGTLLGAGTLKELRQVLTEAELAETGGTQARISPFADGYDGAALLQRAGFALPVSDVDRLTVTYPDLFALVRDLRAMGETNQLAGVIRPLSRPVIGRAAALYAERHANADGRIPATFEIVNLSGWAPHDSQPQPLPRGSARTRLADALGVVEHGRRPTGH